MTAFEVCLLYAPCIISGFLKTDKMTLFYLTTKSRGISGAHFIKPQKMKG